MSIIHTGRYRHYKGKEYTVMHKRATCPKDISGGCETIRGRLSLGGTKVATSVSIFTTRSSVAKWQDRPRQRWTLGPSMAYARLVVGRCQ
jgi:hypothetical protein